MKTIHLLFILLFVTVVSMQAQDVVAVLPPTTSAESNYLSADEQAHIRKEINLILGSNAAYKILALEHIDKLITNQITTKDVAYSKDNPIEIGRILNAKKLIFIEVLYSPLDDSYTVSCDQIDATTGVMERQGTGQICKREYLNLAAREAASIFAKDPEAIRKKVKKEKDVACRVQSKSFFRVKMPHASFGLSIDYIQKEWEREEKSTGVTEKYSYWGKGAMSGGQFGFRYDKYFAPKFFGLGIHTGLSAGYYTQSGKPATDADGKLSFEEVTLSIPVQGIYRLDFSSHIGCYITYGLVADIGLYSRLKVSAEQQSETFTNIYDDENWGNLKRFNYSLAYGAGIQIDRLMLGVSVSKGLLNQSDDDAFKIRQNRKIQATMTLMF